VCAGSGLEDKEGETLPTSRRALLNESVRPEFMKGPPTVGTDLDDETF